MLQIGTIFQPGMILQQGKPVQIWGMAEAGAEVVIEIQNRKTAVKSGADGQWRGELPALGQSSWETMRISCGEERIELPDIAVGEVWLAGGQSNMEYWMHYEKHYQEEKEHCENHNVRIYTVPEIIYEGQDQDYDYSTMGVWRKATAQDLEYMSAVSYYFAKELQAELPVPVGVIVCSWGGTIAAAWMGEETVKTYGRLWWDNFQKAKGGRTEEELVGNIKQDPMMDRSHPFDNAFTDFALSKTRTQEECDAFFQAMEGAFNPDNLLLLSKPGILYEKMLKQVAPYTLRGVLWYQGESDDGQETAYLYGKMLTALIHDWRLLWQEELPFLVVQLPGYESCMGTPNLHYDVIRDSQEWVANTMDGVYLASISDAGEQYDIHPRDKKVVGHRLALLARGHVYGQEVLCDAPAVSKISAAGQELRIRFDHAGEGLTCPETAELPLTVKARGEEVSYELEACGDELVLTTEKPLSGPVVISFAKSKYYRVELKNSAGIPAIPFEKEIDV